jgi:hypothetical protein
MLRGFFRPLLCSLALVGQMDAQEVVVPRETQKEASTEAAPASESEQTPSESPTPAPRTKRKPREKKSVTPTLEQMRASGALAAEGRNDRSVAEPNKTGKSHQETTPTLRPVVMPTTTPEKREAHIPQKNASRPSAQRGAKLESIGPVRPTMMESGREPSSATPVPKWQREAEQTPPP